MPLIRLFLDICLFKKGPQDAPASAMLLKLALAAYFAVGVVLTALENPLPESVLQVLLEGAMMLAFVWASLLAAGKTGRWLQTAIAMLGTDALLSGFAIPLEVLALAAQQAGVFRLLLLLLMLWNIGVVAHILRHALSQPLAIGLSLSLIFVVFTLQVLILLFGPPPLAG